jgi:hypothetical protein
MKFEIKTKEKALISHEDLISLGWVSKEMKNGMYHQVYEKGNYWIAFQNQSGNEIMSVIATDPIKIEWMPATPEQFRIFVKRPTLEAFNAIMASIH